jgi:hypothetical protein
LRDKKELQKNLTGILSDEKICKKLSWIIHNGKIAKKSY